MLRTIRFVLLAPGHFHAALVHKELPPGVHPRAVVYAPLESDLLQYLDYVRAFNARSVAPTRWEVDVRAGANYFERFQREPFGNTAVLAGRPRGRIDDVLASLRAGLNVIADKPWVVTAADFPKIETAFREADLRDLIAWDMMTERFEVTTALQRDLMRDLDVFGAPLVGTPDAPSLLLESTHYLKKTVAGRPLVRSDWWFDPDEAGIALADVGTHLADLAMWLLFPETSIDYARDIRILDALCWPTPLDREQYEAVTGRPQFPQNLDPYRSGDQLLYFGNGTTTYLLKGAHVKLNVLWDFESEHGTGDTHEAIARGSRATVAVRHAVGADGVSRPELYATAVEASQHPALLAAVRKRCAAWQRNYPGVDAVDLGNAVQVRVPTVLRVGHEAHFGAVVREFMTYFHSPRQMPAWERPNLLAKYYVTSHSADLARRNLGRK